MAPKKASSKADEAAKAALLAAKKGKALALTQSTHQEPTEDNIPRTCEDDTFRTCGPEGQSQPPPGFAPLEGTDLTEDGEGRFGSRRRRSRRKNVKMLQLRPSPTQGHDIAGGQ